ncbi:molybdopterin-dependent oxidoreductase [Arthrobacter sp. GMC3]|uniref:molybdopterin-dependent oxidoreductase n=1 Tax=Arthrobacter sp. GMC3 TaxID=2058894 RepID=UPI0021573481|nr:molybdopterin-dependent oxidoreductase [Arthrobacter sp. GMC3]
MEARRYWAAAGIVCVGVGVAVGELIAAFISPSASPVSAVGQTVIGLLPGGVKEWAIHLFGTHDKMMLLVSMVVVMALLAGVVGLLERARRGLGQLGIGLFGVVGILAVAMAPTTATLSYVAPVVAAIVGILLLSRVSTIFLRTGFAAAAAGERTTHPAGSATAHPGHGPTRRSFLAYMGMGAAVAVIAGGAAVIVRQSAVVVADLRAKVKLPRPVTPAPAVPAAAELAVDGITPLIIDANNFYRIDTALVVPTVNSDTWQLTVTGMVEKEITLNFAQLLAKPMVETYVTIGCVSNEVGGNLVGNARWLGWPVRDLLAEAGVKPGADMVLSRSTDGFTAGTPLEAMTDARNAIIAVGMNGEPLPLVHGFPARLIVPGLYGYVSATKWLEDLKVTTFAADQGYWVPLGWDAMGPIKIASRIDVPRSGATTSTGSTTAAGLAWAPERGISAVQVQLDGGAWQEATLAAALNKDTWVQWEVTLSTGAGNHELKVRAVDGSGVLQTSEVAPPAPNGASGFHTIQFSSR